MFENLPNEARRFWENFNEVYTQDQFACQVLCLIVQHYLYKAYCIYLVESKQQIQDGHFRQLSVGNFQEIPMHSEDSRKYPSCSIQLHADHIIFPLTKSRRLQMVDH